MEDKLNVKVGNAVGAGSFGNVYRALDLKYGSLCALKKIPVPNLSPEDELEYKVSKTLRKTSSSIILPKFNFSSSPARIEEQI